jgi:hypothetical protein
VIQVLWARHGAGQTHASDHQVAWLATHTSKTAVCELMRVAWRTVGSIITRVVADGRAALDPFDGLARIGIDEISYKRGHRYLMVVVDRDSDHLVWAAAGHDKKTLGGFFALCLLAYLTWPILSRTGDVLLLGFGGRAQGLAGPGSGTTAHSSVEPADNHSIGLRVVRQEATADSHDGQKGAVDEPTCTPVLLRPTDPERSESDSGSDVARRG